MARSKWFQSLIVALASTRLALCQPGDRPPAPVTKPAERLITVQEGDRPAQKCRVLKTWQMADGNMALQCEALGTGEMMTIVEEKSGAPASSAVGSRVRTMTTRIFHWGSNRTPPPGVPMPPQSAVVQSPTQMPPPVSGLAAKVATPPSAHVVGQPGTPARAWPAAHSTAPETVADRTDPAAATPPPLSRPPSVTTMVAPMPAQHTAPQVIVVEKPVFIEKPVYIEKPGTGEPGPIGRLFARDTTKPTEAPPTKPAETTPAKPMKPTTAASAKPVKTEVEPAPARDWRLSWGKTEAAKTEPPKVEKPPQASPTRTVSHTPVPNKIDPPRTLPELPRADTKGPDPLKEPVAYSRTPIEKQPAPPKPQETTLPQVATPIKTETPVPIQMTSDRPIPLGAGSVLAAGDVRYVPVPIVTTPNVTRMPHPPHPQVPEAPQPNQGFMARTFGAPATAPHPGAMAKPNEMVNAFTPGIAVDDSGLGGGSAFSGPVPAYAGMTGPMNPMMPPQAMMAQGMVPPNAHAMMARAMHPHAPGNPMMHGTMPMVYPSPMGQPIAYPPGHPGAVQPAMQQMPAMAPDVHQAIKLLQDSLYPSHREVAADKLSKCKAQSNPQVVEALVLAMREDPAASVRAACVRSLVKMQANTPQVITALQALKNDSEASVRHEVEQALSTLTPGRPTGGIQPVGGVKP